MEALYVTSWLPLSPEWIMQKYNYCSEFDKFDLQIDKAVKLNQITG